MRFLDFFSGIGGFRLGMEMAGHECVGHCEIDKYADKSYRAMHKVKESEWYANDITRVEPGDLPEADVYCGGFPCQAFSIAGSRGGFEDTRGTLFFEVMRLANVRRPKYLFLENVKGLLSHDDGKTFGTILETLWECGYDAEWQVCNSKYWVPQNRERIFIVGHIRGQCTSQVFPITEVSGKTNDIQRQIVGTIRARYGNDGTGGYLLTEHKQPAQAKSIGNVNPSGGGMNGEVYDSNGLAPTLTTNKGEGNKIAIPVLTPNRPEKMVEKECDVIQVNDSQEYGSVPRQQNRVYNTNGIAPTLTKGFSDTVNIVSDPQIHKVGMMTGGKWDKMNEHPRRVYGTDGIAPSLHTCGGGNLEPKIAIPVLTPNRPEKRQNGRRFKEDGDERFTLTAQDKHGVVVEEPKILRKVRTEHGKAIRKQYENGEIEERRCNMTKIEPREDGIANTLSTVEKDNYLLEKNLTIRKLTPRECFRLQGFPDDYFDRAAEVNSDSQLYKQAGNSVTVPVIHEIARRLK